MDQQLYNTALAWLNSLIGMLPQFGDNWRCVYAAHNGRDLPQYGEFILQDVLCPEPMLMAVQAVEINDDVYHYNMRMFFRPQ